MTTLDVAPVAPVAPIAPVAPLVAAVEAATPLGGPGLVGRSVPRPDVPPKVDGTFEFSNDVAVPGMLFGATVRSPYASAIVHRVDLAPALARPGVVAGYTHDDVPGARRVGHIVADQPVLADGVVRHQGEPLAFVVASSQQEAWRAAEMVAVDYELCAPLSDPTLALGRDAPQLHPDGNLFRHLELRRGDAAEPAPVEVHGVWETGRQDQAFLAPESAVAIPDLDGGVTLHLATQDLHTDRRQIAAALALPEERVRLRLAGVGGAFGGREDITCQIHLALAALDLGRPVKTTYRRDESFLAHPQRHPARMTYAVGAEQDGTLSYVRARILLDGGAYASTSGPVLGSACYFAAGPYRVPGVHIVGDAVRTNNPVAGAMRGFGAVQACFGIESTMDLLAARLGLDPVQLRRRNALRPGDPFPTTGQAFDASVDVAGLLDRCVALPLPDARRRPPPPPRHTVRWMGAGATDQRTVSGERAHDRDPYGLPGGTGRTSTEADEGVRRGIAVALGIKNHLYGEGVDEWSLASVRISAAGAVVETAAAEVGQGIGSALVQVATDALGGLPTRLATARSEAGYAGSSSASRQTWMASAAVLSACARAVEELALVVARRHGVDPAWVALVDGGVVVTRRAGSVPTDGEATELSGVAEAARSTEVAEANRVTEVTEVTALDEVDAFEAEGASGGPWSSSRRLSLAEALGEEEVEAGARYDAPTTDSGDPTTGQGDVHVSWMVVAHRAVVDVDTELGIAKVVQVATAQDVGRAVNPREVRGQITGGISQGLGLALTEHLSAPAGIVANGSFTDYLIPTAADMPEVVVDLLEPGDPLGPLGLRGVGEPPSLSSTAAIAASLRDATGRPVPRVPARPDDLIA